MDKAVSNTQTSLHISEDVLATVADEAIKEIDGVDSLANLPAKVSLFSTPAVPRPVKIVMNSDVAVLDIGINVRLDCRLKDICEQVQAVVKDAVQNMTGVMVAKVNVFVAGIGQTKPNN